MWVCIARGAMQTHIPLSWYQPLRILGILLAALAIQFVLNGIVEFVHVSGFVK
jgi:hypothetical protein